MPVPVEAQQHAHGHEEQELVPIQRLQTMCAPLHVQSACGRRRRATGRAMAHPRRSGRSHGASSGTQGRAHAMYGRCSRRTAVARTDTGGALTSCLHCSGTTDGLCGWGCSKRTCTVPCSAPHVRPCRAGLEHCKQGHPPRPRGSPEAQQTRPAHARTSAGRPPAKTCRRPSLKRRPLANGRRRLSVNRRRFTKSRPQ